MWEFKQPEGATMFGSHYMSTFDTCQRKWFLQQLAPHPEGGVGLRPRFTPEPLATGLWFHQGIATWLYYKTMASDDPLQKALDQVEQYAREHVRDVEDAQQYERILGLTRNLLERYHEEYYENDDVSVVLDDQGVPIIEREYRIDFPGGYVFTCRVDALVRWREWLYVFEHKTTAASRVHALLRLMRVNMQGSGECYILNKLFPGERVHGILVNAIVKNPGKGPRSSVRPFYRDPIARSEEHLIQFEWDTRRRLAQIEAQRSEFQALVKEGLDPWEAGRRTFPLTGASKGSCFEFSRSCEFLPLCEALGHEPGLVAGYQPRILVGPEVPPGEEIYWEG